MFNPKLWIESVPEIYDHSFTLGDQCVKIRRLTGLQWEHFIKLRSDPAGESPTCMLLHYGLVNERDPGLDRFSIDEMTRFYEHCPVRADKIAVAILELTMSALAEEETIIEQAKKNSTKTDMPLSNDDTAVTMP